VLIMGCGETAMGTLYARDIKISIS